MTTTFASYAAVAIENARLYDTAQEQAYASAALLQVAQAVVSLNDLDEILGTIIRIMPILVGIERAVLYQWEAEGDIFIPVEEYGLGEVDAAEFWSRNFPSGEFAFLDACRDELGLRACQLDDRTGSTHGSRSIPTRRMSTWAIRGRSCSRFPSRSRVCCTV
jgi:GAF domain-containing protein